MGHGCAFDPQEAAYVCAATLGTPCSIVRGPSRQLAILPVKHQRSAIATHPESVVHVLGKKVSIANHRHFYGCSCSDSTSNQHENLLMETNLQMSQANHGPKLDQRVSKRRLFESSEW